MHASILPQLTVLGPGLWDTLRGAAVCCEGDQTGLKHHTEWSQPRSAVRELVQLASSSESSHNKLSLKSVTKKVVRMSFGVEFLAQLTFFEAIKTCL